MGYNGVMVYITDFVVLVFLYFLVFYQKWKSEGRDRLVVNTLMYVYLVFVLYFTLMPIITSLPFVFDHPYVPMNLEPFIDVVSSRGDFVRQIVLNVIMTIPFGFLFPLVDSKKPTLRKTIMYVFFLSLGIEILQPLINSRSSDITDIITNVAGGLIGYIMYLICKPLLDKVLAYIRNQKID